MYSFYDYLPPMGYGGKKGSTFSGNMFYQTGGENIPFPQQSDYATADEFMQAMAEWADATGNQEMLAEMMNQSVDTDEQPTAPSANAPAAFTNKFKLNPYKGVSIADFLANQNKAADYSSRKQLAKQLGITGYRGTASQNAQLMDMIQQNPDVLSSYGDFAGYGVPQVRGRQTGMTPQESSGSYSSYDVPFYLQAPQDIQSAPADFYQYFGNSPQQAAAQPVPNGSNSSSGWMLPAAALTAGTAASIYGVNKFGAPGAIKAAQTAADLAKADLSTEQIIKMAKQQGRTAETYQLLKNRGMKHNDILKALKDIAFKKPGADQKLLKQITESTQKTINQFAKASDVEAANLKKAQRLVTLMKDKGGVRIPELTEQVYALVRNPATANKLLAGLKLPTEAAPEAIKSLGLGSRLAEGLKGVVEGNKLLRGAGQFLRGVGQAVRKDGGQWGGSYIPEYGQFAYGGYHSEIPGLFNQPVDRMNKAIPMASGGSYDNAGFEALPEYVQEKIMRASGKAMYGMDMASGGQMPQWLAERRFAAAGNKDMMSEYGYAGGGEYNIGDEIEVTPEQLEMLKQQGYKFKITG